MITTQSQDARYLVHFTNGTQAALSDVIPAKGGQGAGFGPHELMEASLACCINMWIRMQADKRGISVGPISVSVSLKRDDSNERIFEYNVKVDGTLTDEIERSSCRSRMIAPFGKRSLKKFTSGVNQADALGPVAGWA